VTWRLPHILLFYLGIALLFPLEKTRGQETIIIDPDFHQLITEARAYKNQDKMDLALKALEEAAEWAEDNENDQAAIQTQIMFAEIYLIRGEVDRARSSAIQIQNLLQDNTYNMGLAYYFLVDAQLLLESDKNLFITALQQVREAKKTNNNRNLLNRAALLEGRIFELMGRPDSAIVRYNSLRGDNSDPFEKDYLSSTAHLSLAQLYASQEKVAEAIANAESALEIAKTNEFQREYAESNQLLAKLYRQTGQFQKALESVENMLFLRDSIYTVEKLEMESEISEGVFARQTIEQQKKYEAEIAELSLDMVGETQIVIREQMNGDLTPRRVLLGVNIGPVGGPGEGGVPVQGVTPDSAADAAGIRSGDVLLSIDGLQLDWADDTDPQSKLLARLAEIEPGTRFKVEHRRDGEVLTADVEARPRGEELDFDFDFEELHRSLPPGAQAFVERFIVDRWGDMELVELTPGLGDYFETEEGVLVVRAPSDDTLGLEDGDVILDIAGREPTDARHVVRILRSYEPGERLVMTVVRKGRKQQLEADIPE